MAGCISVINSGSSSIKISLFDQLEEEGLRLVLLGQVDGIGATPRFRARSADGEVLDERSWENGPDIDHQRLMAHIIGWLRATRLSLGLELEGVGHRVVHGGEAYSRPVRVDENVLHTLEQYIPLAPLHQPHNLGAIRAVRQLGGDIPQVACFDTAFHRTNPPEAQMFALPRHLTDEGIRRYGFHGLSYEYIARRLCEINGGQAGGRVVVAHLGSGVSMCALHGGKSVASSMGFSALDGLPMGTRPGNIDPGVLLYLMQEKGMQPGDLIELLYKQSGLLGISGISNDMRVLQESDDPHAQEAIEVFAYRIQRELGSLVAVLGGLDGLVFTAGIGENSPDIRARICSGAGWLGLRLDADANDRGADRISTDDSQVTAWVIPTNEELMIATHTRDLLLRS